MGMFRCTRLVLMNIPAQRKRRLAECDPRAERQHGEDKQEDHIPGEKTHRGETERDFCENVNSSPSAQQGIADDLTLLNQCLCALQSRRHARYPTTP